MTFFFTRKEIRETNNWPNRPRKIKKINPIFSLKRCRTTQTQKKMKYTWNVDYLGSNFQKKVKKKKESIVNHLMIHIGKLCQFQCESNRVMCRNSVTWAHESASTRRLQVHRVPSTKPTRRSHFYLQFGIPSPHGGHISVWGPSGQKVNFQWEKQGFR